MSVLFHQNMRVFGGGVPARNLAYNAAFGAVAAGLGAAGPIEVAGFTEITNNGAAAVQLGVFCAALGVTHIGNIACGQTALAAGPEYIGIGVNLAHPIISVGRIFINTYGGGVNLIHDVAPLPLMPAWCNHVHPNATPDYRGIVYVVINLGGINVAIGFLHNLYTLVAERILVAGQLPFIARLMGSEVPGGIAAGFIGGDYNVGVLSPRGTIRQGRLYAYSNGLTAAQAAVIGAVPGGTTYYGNLYDYWYSSIDPFGPAPGGGLIVPPIPDIYMPTLDAFPGGVGNMSDHTATLLRIV